jgi:serine/threonine protein kinase
MRVKLSVIDGPNRGASFAFSEHDTFIVGRSARAHFRLPPKDKAFSRFHFMIEVNPPLCRIMDMASTNGIQVNGRPVTTVDLRDGDQVRAGLTLLSVSIQGNAAPIEATEAAVDSRLDPATAAGSPDSTVTWRGSIVRSPSPGREPAGSPPPPSIPSYTIERLIGRGGMGIVYRARAESDGSLVALKTICPMAGGSRNTVARFLREASILRQLDHPNIVGYREMGQAGPVLYFAMEYAPGTDARRLVRQKGPLPVALAVGLVRQALAGLAYAHARGFIHRDVKPPNLLLTRATGQTIVKLADFGLARIYQSTPMSGLSILGDFGGTFGFLPPEQITDFRATRPPADQYAIAATLYYMITSQNIYNFPKNSHQRVKIILGQDPVPIVSRRADLPPALAGVIHRALARDPAARYPDVAAFSAALEPFERG